MQLSLYEVHKELGDYTTHSELDMVELLTTLLHIPDRMLRMALLFTKFFVLTSPNNGRSFALGTGGFFSVLSRYTNLVAAS